MAHLPTQRVMATLHHFGISEGEKLESWLKELALIKRDGYAISTSEFDPGVSGVSSPVFSGNKLVGAVSIMAPEDRVLKK